MYVTLFKLVESTGHDEIFEISVMLITVCD